MTEERLESLSLTELRELARERGLSGVSALRKQDLIQKLKGEPRSRIEQAVSELPPELREAADGGTLASGLLEIVSEGGFGFLRSANYLPGEEDVYVSPSQIRRFRLRTGDLVTGVKRLRGEKERYSALLYVNTVNGVRAAELRRANFEEMTPIFPSERIPLSEGAESTLSLRVIDLIAPIGKGQRGLIVAPPKAGKTTLLKEIAKAVRSARPEIHLIVLLIDERPEEVTDIKEYIADPEVEVIYSTFDREPEQHRRVAEMAIERARRITEQHRDVMILLDSITRLARAYNLTVTPSGRTLSGGLDPASLYMPKRFFGAARNMREGGSLTILATALVETGSRMDDVVYEEFKGTGNMELRLSRQLADRRIFPAIDVNASGTRREEMLFKPEELRIMWKLRRVLGTLDQQSGLELVLDKLKETQSNAEFLMLVQKTTPSVE